jgi:RNA recognition motif-containing protein
MMGVPPPGVLVPMWTPPPALLNPAAVQPLTLYIGGIPGDLSNDAILEILNACGTVQKWNRPLTVQKNFRNFGFCTFAQGSSALRCYRVLNGFILNGSQLQVKAGSKEIAALLTIEKSENSQMGNSSVSIIRSAALTSDSSVASQQSLTNLNTDLAPVDIAVREKVSGLVQKKSNDDNVAAAEQFASSVFGADNNDPVASSTSRNDTSGGFPSMPRTGLTAVTNEDDAVVDEEKERLVNIFPDLKLTRIKSIMTRYSLKSNNFG